MPKRTIALLLALLSFGSLCYAQATRNALYNLEGKSNFTHIGVTGQDVDGNPGYLELRGVSTTANTDYTYYLWVGEDGKLRIASYATVSPYASFPSGNWKQDNMGVGTVVGSQS